MTDTILIVDDSSFIVEGLMAILKRSYRTLAVYGGQQCLDILKKEKPSIIILDIMMEPMDGWETLTLIKENHETRHIPVLMFSAKKISAQEAEEHRISIDDFITKPVTPKKLIEAIEKVLTRQKANNLNIELWRSAGIGEDRIDEYTSLMTSLEVDMSLLQNMQVQLSLVREDDNDIRNRLENVIIAIEKRIREEHLHEMKLCREMQDSVAKYAEKKEHAVLVPITDESLNEKQPLKGGTQATDLPGLPKTDTHYKTEIDPFIADIFLLKENDFQGRTIPESPIISKAAYSDIPVLSGTSMPAKNSEIFQLTLSHTREPENEIPFGVITVQNKENIPPVLEQQYQNIRDARPFTARTLDNIPSESDESMTRVIGSGTDTSVRKSPHILGKSGGNKEEVNRNKNLPEKEVSSPSGRFISRILSRVFGVFKRKTK